jgi:hypothetical protein
MTIEYPNDERDPKPIIITGEYCNKPEFMYADSSDETELESESDTPEFIFDDDDQRYSRTQKN